MTRRRDDLVRPFVITDGRTQPSRNTHRLDVLTMVTAVPGKPGPTAPQPEFPRIVHLCSGGRLSVLEVASHLGLTLTVARVLISDLIDAGCIVTLTPQPTAPAGRPHDIDTDILERVLHGLRASL